MSIPSFSEMSDSQKDQLACTLSALILHDNGSDVNAGNLQRVLDAAGMKVASYWPMLFAKALDGKNVADYLVVSGGSGGAGGATEEKKEEEVEEEEEEEVEEEEMDFDMGDLFG
ncbi:MAG: 60S acidic ribosomal protein P1 [Pseudomonadota bacterium]